MQALSSPRPSRSLLTGVWLAQILLALIYIPAGSMKLLSPVSDVAAQIPWAAVVPVWFLRMIGLVDLSAGLGMVLPALTRILPRLTVFAATGSVVLQILAMLFHASRGEWMVIPFNVLIIALSLFVARMRAGKAAVQPRSAQAVN